MNSRKYIKRTICYLLLILTFDTLIISYLHLGYLPNEAEKFQNLILCFLVGGVGGVIYCLRGVYTNACGDKNWDADWLPWYFIRPIVSHFSGAISFLFIKAGLLLLEAKATNNPTDIGYLALAFIAGLNVDKFLIKIEGIAKAAWGIDPSNQTNKNKT